MVHQLDVCPCPIQGELHSWNKMGKKIKQYLREWERNEFIGHHVTYSSQQLRYETKIWQTLCSEGSKMDSRWDVTITKTKQRLQMQC